MPVVVPGETALPARGLPTPTTVVFVSNVQPSLNQEFLCTYFFKMSLYTLNKKSKEETYFI